MHFLLSDLLGHSLNSKVVQSLLSNWEQMKSIDEEDIAKTLGDHRLSLMNREEGLYLFFTDEESFRQRYGAPGSIGSLVLARIVCLVDFGRDFSRCLHELPHGVRSDMGFVQVRENLGDPVDVWESSRGMEKARWTFGTHSMDISFGEDGGVRMVSIAPRYIQGWLKKEGAEFSPEQLVPMFGMPFEAFVRQHVVEQLRLESRGDEVSRYGKADFSSEYGFEFFFKPGSEFVDGADDNAATCFSGVRYRCDLDFHSSGFSGTMPFGITFDDPWFVVAKKVGIPPKKVVEDALDGYQLWDFGTHELHVLSSFLEDRVYRVTFDAKACEA